jgi:nucleotidyltransferase substrate binding protein (TIGR01987 family)
MKEKDIRRQQRFDHFLNAFKVFDEGIRTADQRPLSELETQGLIQVFEFTHELAWNVLKDYLEYQGVFNIVASRDASREAFNKGLVTDGQAWMDMIRSRNLSSHTYSKKVASELILNIRMRYHSCFKELKAKLEGEFKA